MSTPGSSRRSWRPIATIGARAPSHNSAAASWAPASQRHRWRQHCRRHKHRRAVRAGSTTSHLYQAGPRLTSCSRVAAGADCPGDYSGPCTTVYNRFDRWSPDGGSGGAPFPAPATHQGGPVGLSLLVRRSASSRWQPATARDRPPMVAARSSTWSSSSRPRQRRWRAGLWLRRRSRGPIATARRPLPSLRVFGASGPAASTARPVPSAEPCPEVAVQLGERLKGPPHASGYQDRSCSAPPSMRSRIIPALVIPCSCIHRTSARRHRAGGSVTGADP